MADRLRFIHNKDTGQRHGIEVVIAQMHIPSHRVSPQVSLLNVQPTRKCGFQRFARAKLRSRMTIRAQSSNEPLTLFSPSKAS